MNFAFPAPIRRRVKTRLFPDPHRRCLSIPILLSPSIFFDGGQTSYLSVHQGLVESAVAELRRPAIGRWWRLFAAPFKHRLEWSKLRCQATVRLTAANKAMASSESS